MGLLAMVGDDSWSLRFFGGGGVLHARLNHN